VALTTNPTTLNQLVENLRVIADSHLQIHAFKYGNPWEFYQSGTTNSPEMWVALNSVNREVAGVTTFNFNIVIADNVKRGEVNELEVESDIIQICEDIIAYLKHPSFGFNLPNTANITITVRTENSPKNLTTAEFQVAIRIPKAANRCQIPFNNQPITS